MRKKVLFFFLAGVLWIGLGDAIGWIKARRQFLAARPTQSGRDFLLRGLRKGMSRWEARECLRRYGGHLVAKGVFDYSGGWPGPIDIYEFRYSAPRLFPFEFWRRIYYAEWYELRFDIQEKLQEVWYRSFGPLGSSEKQLL